MRRPPGAWLPVFFALNACADPLRDEKIDSLGPEQEGFGRGPTHRPGQPCVLCHSDGGPGSPEMSFGGTLFHAPQTGLPFLIGGWLVEIADDAGSVVTVPSNRCGNFYLTPDDLDPVFPVRVRVLDPRSGAPATTMQGRIAREGACGACHTEPKGPLAAGMVNVPGPDADFAPPTPGSCPEPGFLPLDELPEDVRP
jgi:hypothetical protein